MGAPGRQEQRPRLSPKRQTTRHAWPSSRRNLHRGECYESDSRQPQSDNSESGDSPHHSNPATQGVVNCFICNEPCSPSRIRHGCLVVSGPGLAIDAASAQAGNPSIIAIAIAIAIAIVSTLDYSVTTLFGSHATTSNRLMPLRCHGSGTTPWLNSLRGLFMVNSANRMTLALSGESAHSCR